MSKIRKIITTGLIATTLATAVVVSTPASAWYRRYGWYGGGWGWGAPAIAAIGLGALAVGAVAAGAGAYPYYGGCGYYGSCGYPAAYGSLPGPGAILRHTKPGLRRLGQFCRLPADAGGLLRRRTSGLRFQCCERGLRIDRAKPFLG